MAARRLLRGAASAALLFVVVMAGGVTVASAATVDTKGPVVAFNCEPCHGNIADNKLPGITFSHGAHIIYECVVCHTQFPHQPQGLSIPKMKDCWTCHGVRHGSQGIMAKAQCEKCHGAPRSGKRPKDHVGDWAGRGHVAPAKAGLESRCAMCHTKAQCDACHARTKVTWETTSTVSYNAADGCLSCHGHDLPRLSKTVTGVEASAHRGVGCQSCHPDFRYDDVKAATKLWRVNAGMSCASCHDHDKQTADYRTSVHATAIAKGNYKSATCGSCHGGHDIERLKTDAAKTRLHEASLAMCGTSGCHDDTYIRYADYWHGEPYKAGAADAPACWQCHGAHGVKAVKSKESSVAPENLAATCGTCHEGSTEAFAVAAGSLIHRKAEARSANPLARVLDSMFKR